MKINYIFLKYILLFVIIFCVSFFVTYVCMPIYCDEVWSYGFSYNISQGMIIYRDFNVLQTPLYFMIASLFIRVFGSYLISIHVFDAILVSLIGLMLYRIIKLKFIIVLPFIMIFMPSGYNLLSLFLFINIIYLIFTKKDYEILVAFIIGLMFITKQNIGGILFLPCLFYSKKKFKSIVAFLIPFLLLCVYLIINRGFYQFIDYCFLGILNFNSNNREIYVLFLFLELIALIYLGYKILKNGLKDKEIVYILFFQFIGYPLLDAHHFFISFVPVMYLIVKNISLKNILIVIGVGVFSLHGILFYYSFSKVHFSRDLFFLRNAGSLPRLSVEFGEYVDDFDYFFSVGEYSYIFKLYNDVPIGQYDFLISGNMGHYGGEKKFKEISKICLNQKCLFMDQDNNYGQFLELHNYIVSNYKKIDRIYDFDIYSS